jgi:hypothetical protein
MTDQQQPPATEDDAKKGDTATEPATPGDEVATAPSSEKPAEKAADEPAGKPAEKATDEPAGKPAEQAAEKAADTPAEAAEERSPATPDTSATPRPASPADSGRPAAPQAAGGGLNKKSVLVGFAGGAVAAVAVLALAGYVWPGFLAGPGTPDATAAEVTAAMSSKNPAELDKVSCHGPDGKPTNHMLPPQAMQLIQSVTETAPPRLSLDTEAMAPIELTLSAQGQTQKLPANLVLTVSNGQWCMNGLAQQQQS